MNRAHVGFPLTENSVYVHEATWIGGCEKFRARFLGISSFGITHCAGNHIEIYCERAAEAAAIFAVRHLYQFQTANVLQQLARFIFQVEFAKRVAGIVICDTVREGCADVSGAGRACG